MVLPLLMAAGGIGLTGYGLISGAAPNGGGAIETMLTAKATAARQCVYKGYPSLELPTSILIEAKLKGVISDDYFFKAMAKNGINTTRANLMRETGLPLISIDELANSIYKQDLTYPNYIKKAARLGYNNSEADLLLKGKRSTLSPTDTLNSHWRGHLDRRHYYNKMYEAGYEEEDADLLELSQLFIPSHEDLIRFQVRDVYNDHIVEKYGYDEEFPENILPDAAKIGMSKEVMLGYWKAHWDLPSPTQAYNMVQRLNPEVLSVVGDKYTQMGLDKENLLTDIETLKELLKIADYPKYWRDRMAAISYDPITRVDLRRIYQLGLCSDKFVVATLQEHGYSYNDATLLLEFFKTLRMGKDKKLSEKNVIDSYNYGLKTKTETIQALLDMGYDTSEAEQKLELNKRLLADKDLKEDITSWTVDFTRGIVTEEVIKQRLTLAGVNDKKATVILNKMRAALKKKTKTPPLADLHKFYIKRLLDVDGYRAALKEYGLENKYIDLYVQLNKPSELNDSD